MPSPIHFLEHATIFSGIVMFLMQQGSADLQHTLVSILHTLNWKKPYRAHAQKITTVSYRVMRGEVSWALYSMAAASPLSREQTLNSVVLSCPAKTGLWARVCSTGLVRMAMRWRRSFIPHLTEGCRLTQQEDILRACWNQISQVMGKILSVQNC